MGMYKEYIVKEVKEASPEQKVIGFGGSPRRGGNSDQLLKSIFEGVSEAGVPGMYCTSGILTFRAVSVVKSAAVTKYAQGLMTV